MNYLRYYLWSHVPIAPPIDPPALKCINTVLPNFELTDDVVKRVTLKKTEVNKKNCDIGDITGCEYSKTKTKLKPVKKINTNMWARELSEIRKIKNNLRTTKKRERKTSWESKHPVLQELQLKFHYA
jgi:hypothetical protein